MRARLDITKTYKLFIDGKFPRSESGRTMPFELKDGTPVHLCQASRKDLRDAASAARKALSPWRDATAYLRGQILYRIAEMLEGKRDEFVRALRARGPARPSTRSTAGSSRAFSPDREVTAAIDRLVAFAGWADKYAQILGCNNPVAGPYYNFTVPEPTGVIAVLSPDEPGLLGLIAMLAPPLCAGNAVIALAGESAQSAISAAVLGEVLATSDVPAGVVNILTGKRDELVPFIAQHRDIDGVHAMEGAGLTAEHARTLREGVAENLKRVTVRPPTKLADHSLCTSPSWIEPFVEMKTIWHPSAV